MEANKHTHTHRLAVGVILSWLKGVFFFFCSVVCLADPQVCSADRWGSRRWLTGWGRVATCPLRDYKQWEKGKEIRHKSEAAFLTLSPLSHWQPWRGKLLSQNSIRVPVSPFSTSPPSLVPCAHQSMQLSLLSAGIQQELCCCWERM